MARWALLVLAVAVGAALLAWPGLSQVETGLTPEYPDLQPREYAKGEEEVTKAARRAVEGLGWAVVGSGRGARGSELAARRRLRFPPLEYDLTVRARREGGRTRVSVASRSRNGWRDFGQNSRNVRALLRALDAELSRR